MQIRAAAGLLQSLSFSSFKYSCVIRSGTRQTPRPFNARLLPSAGICLRPLLGRWVETWSVSGAEQAGPRSCAAHMHVSAVFFFFINPHSDSNLWVSVEELASWCIHCPGKKPHAWLISLVLRAWTHPNSTVWMFSLLCGDNAGWGTVERTGATPRKRKWAPILAFWPSPSLRPLLFISGNNTRRKCAESPVAFQRGGSWTAEGAALINGWGGGINEGPTTHLKVQAVERWCPVEAEDSGFSSFCFGPAVGASPQPHV